MCVYTAIWNGTMILMETCFVVFASNVHLLNDDQNAKDYFFFFFCRPYSVLFTALAAFNDLCWATKYVCLTKLFCKTLSKNA